MMLKNLRLRLSLLYLFAAMLLVAILGGSAYSVLFFYFQDTNDFALRTKMGLVLNALGGEIPIELSYQDHEGDSIEDDDNPQDIEEIYEGELSAIFVLPLNAAGELLFNPNPYSLPMKPDLAALDAALISRIDFRNVVLDNGSPARLLTYAIPELTGIEVIQVGKSIVDQAKILNQFLMSLLVIGGVSVIVLGVGSWWMAGRFLASHESAWENQQVFIANASHELRTPLTLIRAGTESVLRHTKKGSNSYRLLEDIIAETDYMRKLIQDLLLLTRLDTGKLKFIFSEIDLHKLLSSIERQFGNLAKEIPVKFLIKGDKSRIRSDQTRLRQILLILLDNAFQHTPAGGKVTLAVFRQKNEIKFEITDTGEGIPQNHLPYVFDRFYQVKTDRGGENHGSGLGLSIAHDLIDGLHGRIRIESGSGRGTSVSVYLPINTSD